MPRMVQLGIGLAWLAMFVTCTPSNARSDEVLSPAQRGFVILKTNCSRCHAISKVGESPLKIAPPFRTLHERYHVEDLEEPLAEGIITGHPTMPEFRFDQSGSGRGHHRVSENTRALTASVHDPIPRSIHAQGSGH
jgi:cytochrome c